MYLRVFNLHNDSFWGTVKIHMTLCATTSAWKHKKSLQSATEWVETLRPKQWAIKWVETLRPKQWATKWVETLRPKQWAIKWVKTLRPKQWATKWVETLRPKQWAIKWVETLRPEQWAIKWVETLRPKQWPIKWVETLRPKQWAIKWVETLRPKQWATKWVETLRQTGLFYVLLTSKGGNIAFPPPTPPCNAVPMFKLPVENNKHPNFKWRGQGRDADSFLLWGYPIWVPCLNNFVADCEYEVGEKSLFLP